MITTLDFLCLVCYWFQFILLPLLLVFLLLILQVFIEVRNLNFFDVVLVFSINLTIVQVRVRFILTLDIAVFRRFL